MFGIVTYKESASLHERRPLVLSSSVSSYCSPVSFDCQLKAKRCLITVGIDRLFMNGLEVVFV